MTGNPFQRSLIAIATYNERENLENLVRSIRSNAPQSTILIIDDNSPDGTGELAEKLARDMGRIQVQHRPGKLGLGTAMVQAMKSGIDQGFETVVTMDADLSHDPIHLPHLINNLTHKDVMIGSRYIPGGGTKDWPLVRLTLSRSVNLMVRTLHGLPARDNSGGFRAYKTEILKRIDIDGLVSVGYSFQEEMLLRCHRAGARIGETPIVFANRREGASKVNIKECVRSVGTLLYLAVPTWMGGPNLAPLPTTAPLTQTATPSTLRKSA